MTDPTPGAPAPGAPAPVDPRTGPQSAVPVLDRFRLDGRVAVITGASSGLGAEMARQFADLGHDLALCARRTERLDELKAELEAKHPQRRVELRALDVNDHEQVFEVFRAFRTDFGPQIRELVDPGHSILDSRKGAQ